MTKLTGALTKLQIQNFKSLKDVSISPGRVNVFIGKPNAGKTNLLEALTLLGMDFHKDAGLSVSNIRYTDLRSLFYDQNLNHPIKILSDQKATSMVAMEKENFWWRMTDDSSEFENIAELPEIDRTPTLDDIFGGSVHGVQLDSYGVVVVGEVGEVFSDSPFNINRYQFYLPTNHTEQAINGKSLWDITRHNSYLKSFAKDFFKEFSLEVLYDKENKMNIMKRSEDSFYLIDFSMTPDTFQRMLYYLAVTEANKNSVILLEEPESQSYPPYIQMLADKIVDDKHNQYFITTHSPFIVEKMLQKAGPDGDVKIFVTYFEDYQTKVHELTPTEIDYIIGNSIDLFFNIESFQK